MKGIPKGYKVKFDEDGGWYLIDPSNHVVDFYMLPSSRRKALRKLVDRLALLRRRTARRKK